MTVAVVPDRSVWRVRHLHNAPPVRRWQGESVTTSSDTCLLGNAMRALGPPHGTRRGSQDDDYSKRSYYNIISVVGCHSKSRAAVLMAAYQSHGCLRRLDTCTGRDEGQVLEPRLHRGGGHHQTACAATGHGHVPPVRFPANPSWLSQPIRDIHKTRQNALPRYLTSQVLNIVLPTLTVATVALVFMHSRVIISLWAWHCALLGRGPASLHDSLCTLHV